VIKDLEKYVGEVFQRFATWDAMESLPLSFDIGHSEKLNCFAAHFGCVLQGTWHGRK
jgi:hypothetical protein